MLANGQAAAYQQSMGMLAELPDEPALNIAVAEYVALKKLIGPVSPVEVAGAST